MTTLTMSGRMRAGALTVLLAAGTFVATAQSSSASIVPNYMRCEPDTGWCYQKNPPANNSVPHYCQWDYTLHNLHSGMWYTGCNHWDSDIH